MPLHRPAGPTLDPIPEVVPAATMTAAPVPRDATAIRTAEGPADETLRAQIRPTAGERRGEPLPTPRAAIERGLAAGAELILFPELSLTGY